MTKETGITYLLEGFKLIFKPGMKRFVLIPLLINLLLFCGTLWISLHFFNELNHWLINRLPYWLHWLSGVLWALFFVSFVLIISYTFVTLANIISAPFNSLLAEQVEFYLTGKKLASTSFLKDTPRIIGRQLAILGFYLPRALLLLLLFFIPLLQLFAAPLWFLFNAWFMALQCIDYPTDNHKISLTTVRTVLQREKLLTLTFGSSVLMLTMIPIINCLVIPAAVAGATLLWITEFENDQK